MKIHSSNDIQLFHYVLITIKADFRHLPVNLPDAVVVPHHVDALRVRQVAVVDEEAEDAPAAEVELLPDDALEVGHHAARVQVHEQPAHPAVHHGRRRVVEVEPQADKVAAVGSHDDKRACVRERHNKTRQTQLEFLPPATTRTFPFRYFRTRVGKPVVNVICKIK